MLKKLLGITVIIFSLNISIKGQITDDYKNEILQKLADPRKSWTVIDIIIKLKMTDAIPVLETNFWKNRARTQLYFLDALAYLQSPNTGNLALEFIDSVDQYDEKKMDDETKLGIKAYINKTLFKVNDYSKADYVIQQLRVQPTDIEALRLLPGLVRHLPQYKDESKNILLNATINAQDDDYQFMFEAVEYLEEIFGAEMIPLYLQFFKNTAETSDSSNRYGYAKMTSFEFLCKYNYSNLENLIKEQLYIETASSYKLFFIDTLLSRFGKPENIVFIKEYLNWESDSSIKDMVGYALRDFVPKKFSDDSQITSLIDSLSITINKCNSFNWIENNFSNDLISRIQNSKLYLSNGDSLNCAKQIKIFQRKVDIELNDSLNTTPAFVTIDAWKFLYNYSQYILDRLPAIPPPVLISLFPAISYVNGPALIMNITGSSFDPGALVMWNDLNKSTTFISDKLVQTNITSSDLLNEGQADISIINEDGNHSNILSFNILPGISNMLDSLISFTNQLYNKGWIDNGGIKNSLVSKLENAQKDLQKNNNAAAKNKLEAYSSELQAQRGKHINEEAFTLLKYYSDYIISGL